MYRVPILVVWVCLALASTDVRRESLTNDDVLALVRAGFSEAVVVQAIRTGDTRFDTSAGALVYLKKAGVSDIILRAMQTFGKESPHLKLLEPGVYVTHQNAYALVRTEPITWQTTLPESTPQAGGLLKLRLVARIKERTSHQYMKNTAELLIVCRPGETAAEYSILRADIGDEWREFRVEVALRGTRLLGLSSSDRVVPILDVDTSFDLGVRVSLRSLPAGEYGLVPAGLLKEGRLNPMAREIYTFTID